MTFYKLIFQISYKQPPFALLNPKFSIQLHLDFFPVILEMVPQVHDTLAHSRPQLHNVCCMGLSVHLFLHPQLMGIEVVSSFLVLQSLI